MEAGRCSWRYRATATLRSATGLQISITLDADAPLTQDGSGAAKIASVTRLAASVRMALSSTRVLRSQGSHQEELGRLLDVAARPKSHMTVTPRLPTQCPFVVAKDSQFWNFHPSGTYATLATQIGNTAFPVRTFLPRVEESAAARAPLLAAYESLAKWTRDLQSRFKAFGIGNRFADPSQSQKRQHKDKQEVHKELDRGFLDYSASIAFFTAAGAVLASQTAGRAAPPILGDADLLLVEGFRSAQAWADGAWEEYTAVMTMFQRATDAPPPA